MKKVLLIGDSIRMGYEKYVKEELRGKAILRSPKQNTYSSNDILLHFDDWILNSGADIVHINSGLHDIKRDKIIGKIVVENKAYSENLETIISRINREASAVIIWATTTPIIEKWHNACKEFDRFTDDIIRVNETAVRICRKHGVHINDLYGIFSPANIKSVIEPDGVHFTENGYKILGKEVTKAISDYL